MVKNEEKRIHVTLNSVKNIVDEYIVCDTGSTDKTIDIIEKFCEDNNKKRFILNDDFIDFSTNRNKLIEFAKSVSSSNYYLLLDCNDEFITSDIDEFNDFLEENNADVFLLKQVWKTTKISMETYNNIRIISSDCTWRYKLPVHEILVPTKDDEQYDILCIPNTYIYQDRTKDDDKSKRRLPKDKEMLLKVYNEFNEDDKLYPRILFYLGQTCLSLEEKEEAYFYYTKRVNHQIKGFDEERYLSMLRLGLLSELIGKEWGVSLNWYLEAYTDFNRVEPILRVVEYYRNKNNHSLAYIFSKLACNIPIPENNAIYDEADYLYTRWHIMGVVAYYVGELKDGMTACINALQYKDNTKDRENLQYYNEALNSR